MKLIIVFVRVLVTASALSKTGVSNDDEDDDDDERLTSLLRHFVSLETSSEWAAADVEESGATATATVTASATATATASQPSNLPYFEDTVDGDSENVTAQFGNTVTLHCRVRNLSDKVVSWVRRCGDKMHLLSYGRQVYSSDGRYQMEYRQPNDWQLRIRFANDRDGGHYECQVSSHPPLVLRVYLRIVVPELEIADERELPIKNKFYNVGSTIELRCAISNVPHQPNTLVTWKHGTRILNYDAIRGGINVKTEILADGAQSRLFVANARTSDSGNYTCALEDVAATYVTVQVLNGETPAAIQHGGSSDRARFHCVTIFLFAVRLMDEFR